MAADGLDVAGQIFHRRADVALCAAHIHHQRARPEQGADLGQHIHNRAHRRRQNHNVRAGHAGVQIGGGLIHRILEEGGEGGFAAPGYPAHFPAELGLHQVHTEACAHQPQADDSDAAVGESFGH